MRKVLSFILCFVITHSFAQTNFIVSEGFYGGREWLLNSIELNDGSYIAIGFWDNVFEGNRIIKIDKNGQLIWHRMLTYYPDITASGAEGYGIIKTSDGGFAISGSLSVLANEPKRMTIYKFGANDSLQWVKQYGDDSTQSIGNKMIQTADGGYMIAGWKGTKKTEDYNSYIVKTDASGKLQWSKKYFQGKDNSIKDLQKTKDNNYVFLSINQGLTDSSYIIKINSSGNILWSKYFYYPLSETYGYTILSTSDNGYLVTGTLDGATTKYDGRDGFILKLDSNGNRLWSKITNNDPPTTNLYSSVETDDGSYVAGGDYERYTDTVFSYLLKVDKNGNLLWSKIFFINQFSTTFSLMKTSDGGYLGTGRTQTPPQPDSYIEGFLIKFDSDFNSCISSSSIGSLKDFGKFSTATVSAHSVNSTVYNEMHINFTDSFTYENLCNTLPVNLLNFTAQKQNNSALLQWQTADEINNNYFNVERSSNSKIFSSIGTKQGLNNDGINNYSFTDNAPLKGINYYRLKQVDKDGKFSYSGIASVEFLNDKTVFAVTPNPANNIINVVIPQNNSVSEIIIYNVVGKKILHEQIAANITSKQINISTLTPGVYNVVLIQNGKKEMMKLVKK